MSKKPTIAELEAILDEPGGNIEIQPDGSIRTVDNTPSHSKPRILTLRKALSDSY